MRGVRAVMFATPEYNRSVPGVAEERDRRRLAAVRQERVVGKPAAVISVSPGALGAFGANHHLRQSLVFLDMPALQQPEAYIGGADKLFDASGKLTNDSTRGFLKKYMATFAAWIEGALHYRHEVARRGGGARRARVATRRERAGARLGGGLAQVVLLGRRGPAGPWRAGSARDPWAVGTDPWAASGSAPARAARRR